MSADSSGLLLHLQILSALATVLGGREKSNFENTSSMPAMVHLLGGMLYNHFVKVLIVE